MCLYYVEAGKDGLKKAEEKYDPKADFSFDSYAVWWIRQRIIQAIESKKKRRYMKKESIEQRVITFLSSQVRYNHRLEMDSSLSYYYFNSSFG